MAEIRDEGPLGDLSMRGGPLISRFEAMRRELPACREPLLRNAAEVLDMIFANHALALHAALDMLAVSWRSDRMREELHRLEGLGRPAIWLQTIRDELAEELRRPPDRTIASRSARERRAVSRRAGSRTASPRRRPGCASRAPRCARRAASRPAAER